MSISPIYIKTGVAAVAGSALDRFVCGTTDMTQNAYFGASVGLGVGVGSYISSLTPAMLPNDPNGLYTGKGVMDRTFEILGGTASSYIISKYLTKQNNNSSMTTKLLCIVASDFIAEYTTDFVLARPMQYLA